MKKRTWEERRVENLTRASSWMALGCHVKKAPGLYLKNDKEPIYEFYGGKEITLLILVFKR